MFLIYSLHILGVRNFGGNLTRLLVSLTLFIEHYHTYAIS